MSWLRRLAVIGGTSAITLAVSGCVVAPPYPHRGHFPVPRVSVWVGGPIWFVPVPGYRHGEGAYDRDRAECYRYAVRETGVDPGGYTPVQEPAPPPSGGGAEVAAGAAVGAVAGGIVGSPRNGAAGMVIGAILGAAVGSAAAEQRERAERAERAERDARARRDGRGEGRDEMTREEQREFRRAMGECMERRGYRPRY